MDPYEALTTLLVEFHEKFASRELTARLTRRETEPLTRLLRKMLPRS